MAVRDLSVLDQHARYLQLCIGALYRGLSDHGMDDVDEVEVVSVA